MILVHDDDLEGIDGIGEGTVSGRSIYRFHSSLRVGSH
jgi:hypothetical protein